MSIAADLKVLGEDIVASYDTRVKAIGVLVKDTRNMVKDFHGEHKEMSAKLKADLAKGEKDRLGDFSAMMAKIQDFVSDVAKEVSTMIKKFQTEHKAMSAELSEDLAKGEGDRAKAFKAMMAHIQKEIKAVETYVAGKLKEFNDAHAEMSEELKKELAKYVVGVVSDTRKMLAGFADERESMAANWQSLTATMAKKRAGKAMKVEAGEKVKTVEEALAKPKKRGRKKGGKRKKKA